MLKKLLKYEFKSVSKILVPVLWGTLALAILASILFTINFRYISNGNVDHTVSTIFSFVMMTIVVFAGIAIVASALVVTFILLQRYYLSFFKEEGYLTFTLPCNTKQHLNAKLISGMVWTVLSVIVIIVSVFMMILFGTAASGQIINTDITNALSSAFSDLFEMIGTTNSVLYIVELLIMILVATASQLLLYYLAITIGSIIAKKHKILASIGAYLGINTGISILTNIFSVVLFTNDNIYRINTFDDFYNMSHLFIWGIILINAGLGIAAYFISDNMLKKKLNLE